MAGPIAARVLAGLPGPGPALTGFIAGVALQLGQSGLWRGSAYAVLAALGLALMGLLVRAARNAKGFTRRASRAAGLALCLAAALLGFGLTGWRASVFDGHRLNPALEGRDIEVTGQVLAMPQSGEEGVRFRLGVASARLDGQPVTLPPQLLLGWYAGFGAREAKADAAESGEALVLELQRQPQPLQAGERWQMTVRLKAPHGNSNPHGFDYELWLWEQGIQATGYVRAGAHDAPPRRLSESRWAHPVERARQQVRSAIYQRVEDRQIAGVLVALVVGDQNAIERADWDVFRATGVAHLMSISGLHITMFAWAASWLIGAAWRRSARFTPRPCLALPASSAAAWGGLVLATAYALFSGWGVPAQRTIWMLATVVLLRQSGRQWPWLSTWLLAMLVVVTLDPWALTQAGFWLSFVAVGVLFATDSGALHTGLMNPAVDSVSRFSGLGRVAAGLGRLAREQWVITLALTPLSLLLFNEVSLVGLLANALAIPWVTLLVTPLAMLGVIYAPVWDVAAGAVGWLAGLLTGLAAWPLASVSVASAPLWCAVAGVLGGGLMAMRLPWHWRVLGVPLLLPVLLWQPLRVPAGQFELLAADVGQGNAVLVRTAHHGLLYDTGPRFSSDSDAGSRVLVPLLKALGQRLDMVMLSHRDLDHIGGASAVLAMQPQARLLGSLEDGHALQALHPSVRCAAGQRWVWDGVSFEVLHPLAADYEGVNRSNAMSCVLRISNASRTALLAGDIEAAQEWRLATSEPERLKADILLVPHHGSKTSSSAVFLDAVQPQLALVQAGYRSRFGHPAAPVVARYEARGIRLVRSDRCGAATWQSQQPEAIRCQRQAQAHYWQRPPEP
ncbi:MAG: DNA internalization-related competence protein ComEC/Rec2 [Pseudomonadota bacterium]|nr:DNA internalization-related competence protein ComEC/Rec2 [Pseudomonadota bacterium]